MVRVSGLRKSYGTVEAVRGVALDVQRGQVVVIIGPSGCGKSTFLRCLNLLEQPSAGTLQVGDRTIVAGDTVVIDVGALVDGYHSDMTRSYVIGEPTAQQREIYDLVQGSQTAGLEALRNGVTAPAVDSACRDVFDAAGYGDWYLHGTGHGVGLEIHEPPFHSQVSDEVIQTGNVVTIEPGLYRQGFGGIRIEDLVVVTSDGHRVLTHHPKQPFAS